MPEYRQIYNDVFAREINYQLAEHSPGFTTCLRHQESLRWLRGRALDVGCGAGFVVELLARRPFQFQCWGADISDQAVALAQQRVATIPGMEAGDRIVFLEGNRLPFADDFFQLVTCFDVLEHLDEADIVGVWREMERVLRPSGLWFGSVSVRPSGTVDRFGDNLHRTVRSVDWWLELLTPDRAEFDAHHQQLTVWKRSRGSTPS